MPATPRNLGTRGFYTSRAQATSGSHWRSSPPGLSRAASQNPGMRIFRFDATAAEAIEGRPYAVELASSITVAEGDGEAHVYVVYFEPGGVIGPHEAGFGQLFVIMAGGGWVAGGDGERVPLGEGEAAFIPRGEVHSKGSETGLAALMVQVRDLAPQAA